MSEEQLNPGYRGTLIIYLSIKRKQVKITTKTKTKNKSKTKQNKKKRKNENYIIAMGVLFFLIAKLSKYPY